MKALALAVVILLGASASSFALSPSDQEARDVALHWVTLLDRGHYKEAFSEQTPRVRNGGDVQRFETYMRARRGPLGAALTRSFWQVKALHQMIGAPDGNYQKIAFKTKFARKAQAVEGVIVTHERGRWEVSGYHFW